MSNVRLRFGAPLAVLVFAAFALLVPTVAHATSSLEERKLPMRFTWNSDVPSADCKQKCSGWIAAVGVITEDTSKAFEEFAGTRDLHGATVVLDSGGGSVLDAIKLGRRWRDLAIRTTVGRTVTASGDNPARITPEAYCESMCVFLLLSGDKRYVPPEAHVRVHQIWMGDRTEDAKTASYTAQDLMIVQRDVGRLTKYAFEMGASGELLALALSVPPWEPLRELSQVELRQAHVTNADAREDVLPPPASSLLMSNAVEKSIQDRFVGSGESVQPASSTKTAEAGARTGHLLAQGQ
jgi:hypothetical protein